MVDTTTAPEDGFSPLTMSPMDSVHTAREMLEDTDDDMSTITEETQNETSTITEQTQTPRSPRRRPRQTRQTVQWPFQSISLDDHTLPDMPVIHPPIPIMPGPNKAVSDAMMPSPKVAYFPRPDTTPQPVKPRPTPPRPVTWQPRARIPKGFGNSSFDESDDDNCDQGTLRRSLIPDYVINYLRGDTPETIAQRLQHKEKEDQQKDDDHRGDMSPSPGGFRSSDEPILPHGRTTYARDRRHSAMSIGRRRAQMMRAQAQDSFFSRGWRAGMALHALAALVVLIVGLVCLVLALTATHDDDDTGADLPGQAVIFSCTTRSANNTCASVYTVVWVVRAVLAVATVAILAGAQYTMQVLSSPTRAEIDVAHHGTPTGLLAPRRHRQWLDIGVPSVRNLFFLLRSRTGAARGGQFRAILAIVALATALATAVLYGALIDTTVLTPRGALPTYDVLLVAESFGDGAPFSNSSSHNAGGLSRLTLLQLQQAASRAPSTLRNITADGCLQAASPSFSQSSYSSALDDELSLFASAARWSNVTAVLVVLDNAAVTTLNARNSSVVQTAPKGAVLEASGSADEAIVYELDKSLSARERSIVILDRDAVSYCLVQEAADILEKTKTETTHNVTLNTTLLAATLGLNVITFACFAFPLLHNTRPNIYEMPLVTLGDAIASFLRDPDLTTRGACLLSKRDVKDGLWDRMADVAQLTVKTNRRTSSSGSDGPRQSVRSVRTSLGHAPQPPENIMQPMFLAPKAGDTSAVYYWYRSVAGVQWLVSGAVWWVLAGLAAAGLAVAVSKSDAIGAFGRFHLADHVWGISASAHRASTPVSSYAALLASLPQLGVGLLYCVADAHLSSYFLSHEAAAFIAHQDMDSIQPEQHRHARRPLRVSYRPRGHQTTSLYLTLPAVWSVLLLVLAAALSFALGQSIVVAGLASTTDGAQLVLVGFSGVGFIVVVALLVVTAVLVLGLGGCRTPPPPGSLAVGAARAASSPSAPPPARRNPLTLPGGSCSAVISARCHPLPQEMAVATMSPNPGASSIGGPLPLWLRPLAWGPASHYRHPYQGYNRRHAPPQGIDSGDDDNMDNMDTIVGHCTFSNGPLVPLDTGRSYA